MSQRNEKKDRVCRSCQGHIYGTAKDIKAHASDCARLQAIGLILPTIVAPDFKKE